jgi:hypothetical protein
MLSLAHGLQGRAYHQSVGLNRRGSRVRQSGAAPRLVADLSSVTVRRDFLDCDPHQIHNPATTRLRNSNTTPADKMADQVKQTRNAINAKKQAVQGQERERVEWGDQVSTRIVPLAYAIARPKMNCIPRICQTHDVARSTG